ncbi:MAG: recombination mediator RecR [Candidatus Adiutrix sp.]
MADHHPPVLTELIDRLAQLPGLGRKTATRLSLFFLGQPEGDVKALAQALVKVKEEIRFCSMCHNFTDQDPCPRCTDSKRDRSLICVVETPSDLMALERAGFFSGLFHVLGGALAPLAGVGPKDLKIAQLIDRIEESGTDEQNPKVCEVLLATGSSPEGESTATYLADKLKQMGVTVTRLARGIPMGVDLEYVDGATLKQSLDYRRHF